MSASGQEQTYPVLRDSIEKAFFWSQSIDEWTVTQSNAMEAEQKVR